MILSSSEKKSQMQFDCIHHGKARDTRKIDHHDSDTPTVIYSQVLRYLDLNSSGIEIWKLTISNKVHLAPNPLDYI